jgi:hypothetical protein
MRQRISVGPWVIGWLGIGLPALLLACRAPAAEKVEKPAEKSDKAAAPRPAAPPVAAPAGEKQLIIWGGGATPAEAEKALAEWNSDKKLVAGVLDLASGFPRVVASKDVPGLKAGFHVVVLGACVGPALEKPLRAIQGLRRGAYAKPGALADAPAEACPSSKAGFQALDLERLKQGSQELSLIGFRALDSEKSPSPWVYRFILREANGTFLDAAALESTDGVANGCEGPDYQKKGGSFNVVLDCVGPGSGPLPAETRVQVSYSVSNSKIVQVIKRSAR